MVLLSVLSPVEFGCCTSQKGAAPRRAIAPHDSGYFARHRVATMRATEGFAPRPCMSGCRYPTRSHEGGRCPPPTAQPSSDARATIVGLGRGGSARCTLATRNRLAVVSVRKPLAVLFYSLTLPTVAPKRTPGRSLWGSSNPAAARHQSDTQLLMRSRHRAWVIDAADRPHLWIGIERPSWKSGRRWSVAT